MNEDGHNRLVRLAIGTLRGVDAEFWQPLARGIAAACMDPDVYAIRLYEGKTGPWRKYFPPGRQANPFFIPGRDFRSLVPKFGFYINKVVGLLRKGDLAQAARYAGIASHYIADFAQPAHYYELDAVRLLPPPPEMANFNPHRTIEDINATVERIRHRPCVLGANAGEFLFRLEGRLAQQHRLSMASIVPMLQAIYRRRHGAAARVFDKVMAHAAGIFADFLATAGALAAGERAAGEGACDLRLIEPHQFDVEFNFGYRPLIDAITIKNYGLAQPLSLLDARGRPVNRQGICIIPHALPVPGSTPSASLEYHLPPRTFIRFEALVGLLASEPRQAKCLFKVIADGKTVFATPMLSPGDAAVDIFLDIRRCRRLVLYCLTDGSTDKLAYAVWAQPRLLK